MNLFSAIASVLGFSRHEVLAQEPTAKPHSRPVPYAPRIGPVHDRQYRRAQRKYRNRERIDLRRVRSYSLRDEAVWRAKTGVISGYGRRFDCCQKPLTTAEWKWLSRVAAEHTNENVSLEARLLLDWNGR